MRGIWDPVIPQGLGSQGLDVAVFSQDLSFRDSDDDDNEDDDDDDAHTCLGLIPCSHVHMEVFQKWQERLPPSSMPCAKFLTLLDRQVMCSKVWPADWGRTMDIEYEHASKSWQRQPQNPPLQLQFRAKFLVGTVPGAYAP